MKKQSFYEELAGNPGDPALCTIMLLEAVLPVPGFFLQFRSPLPVHVNQFFPINNEMKKQPWARSISYYTLSAHPDVIVMIS